MFHHRNPDIQHHLERPELAWCQFNENSIVRVTPTEKGHYVIEHYNTNIYDDASSRYLRSDEMGRYTMYLSTLLDLIAGTKWALSLLFDKIELVVE